MAGLKSAVFLCAVSLPLVTLGREPKRPAKQNDQSQPAATISPFTGTLGDRYRTWATLGGAKASKAKLVDCDDAIVTLEKRDGKQLTFHLSRMRKADRDYLASLHLGG